MATSIVIKVLDASGRPLADRGDVDVADHSSGRPVATVRDRLLTTAFRVPEVQGLVLYDVRVFPSRHRPVGAVVQAGTNGVTRLSLVCPVRPERVRAVDFPPYPDLPGELKSVLEASDVEGFGGRQGEALYLDLDSYQRAGLLNLFAKMRDTRLAGDRNVWSYLRSLYRVRGDRVFCDAEPALRDQVKTAVTIGRWEEVSGALHTPPHGFQLADSFKTFDPYGNLQLTFFSSLDAPLRFKMDADIDDARGVGHAFQVLRNFVSAEPTHPYDIHEILVYRQRIDPGYALHV